MEQKENDVKKEVSPELQAKRDEKKKVRNSALAILKELCDKQEDKKYKNALIAIKPSLYGVARVSTGGTTATIIKYVVEKRTVNEMEIFKQFKIGRREMAGHIRKNLKKVEPAERVWIDFDANSGEYKMAGKGENPPKDWKGYVPVQENIELK